MAKFTNVDDRRYKQIEWGPAALPPCDAPFIDDVECDKPGEFDCPTPHGPWASLCEHHEKAFATKGHQIGFHRIQHPR